MNEALGPLGRGECRTPVLALREIIIEGQDLCPGMMAWIRSDLAATLSQSGAIEEVRLGERGH